MIEREKKILILFSKILLSTFLLSIIQILFYPEPFNFFKDAISWLSGVKSERSQLDNFYGMVFGIIIYAGNIVFLIEYLYHSSKDNLFYNIMCFLLIPFNIFSAFPHDVNNNYHVFGILSMLLSLALIISKLFFSIKEPKIIALTFWLMWAIGIYYIFSYFLKLPFYQFIQKLVIFFLSINLLLFWIEATNKWVKFNFENKLKN